jgi:hypothetical protein
MLVLSHPEVSQKDNYEGEGPLGRPMHWWKDILSRILQKECVRVWFCVTHDRDRTHVNRIVDLPISQTMDFLTSWMTIIFSRRTLLHELIIEITHPHVSDMVCNNFPSLHFSVFCQVTEFSYDPGLVGHQNIHPHPTVILYSRRILTASPPVHTRAER